MFYYNKFYQEDLKKILNIDLPFENFKNKNILVTGANGLIASCLVDALVYLRENKSISFNIYILCRNKVKAENRFKSFKEFKTALEKYISYYNNDRIVNKLKGLIKNLL